MENTIPLEVHALPAFITVTGVAKGPRRHMNDRTCRASDLGPVLQVADRVLIGKENQKCIDAENYSESDNKMEHDSKSHENDDSSDDESSDNESDEDEDHDIESHAEGKVYRMNKFHEQKTLWWLH